MCTFHFALNASFSISIQVGNGLETDWPKLDLFKFLILDILSARRVSAELQLESQSEPMGSSGI
jgi:hypothetical protein